MCTTKQEKLTLLRQRLAVVLGVAEENLEKVYWCMPDWTWGLRSACTTYRVEAEGRIYMRLQPRQSEEYDECFTEIGVDYWAEVVPRVRTTTRIERYASEDRKRIFVSVGESLNILEELV